MSKEIILNEDIFLVSETNEKGYITFANEDFCKASGYSLNELIGNPHNIVRHPDMPQKAFEDLWVTIKNGKVWTGYVKNKAKNGDFYWVFATVFPLIHSDGSKSFISCRVKPSIEETVEVNEIYNKLK